MIHLNRFFYNSYICCDVAINGKQSRGIKGVCLLLKSILSKIVINRRGEEGESKTTKNIGYAR